MKKYFITGLVILLPLAVTLVILIFLFNLLTEPFAGVIAQLFARYDLLDQDYFIFTGHQIQFFISQVLILFFLFFFTVLLGVIARYFFFHYLLKIWDYTIHKIPLIRSIYKASKDVINTIFTSKTKSFKQVVLVPFPHRDALSVGLVTQDNLEGLEKDSDLVAVFVPTTPNPTSGFLMMFQRKDLIYLDMKVENAFKYVISCGVIVSPFSVITYEQAKEKIEKETLKQEPESQNPELYPT